MQAADLLEKHFRLTPGQRSGLKKLGILRVRDLLYHFPARYEASGSDSAIAGLVPGTSATVFGTIEKLQTRRSWKRKIPIGEARIRDASGTIAVMWFHQPYLAKKFRDGQYVKASGTVGGSAQKPYLANPEVQLAEATESGLFQKEQDTQTSAELFAVYPESRGVSSLWFRHALEKVRPLVVPEDPLPAAVRERYHLPDLASALLYIHKPDTLAHAEAARKRFSFEEIFVLQVARALERAATDSLAAYPIPETQELAGRFIEKSGFTPTDAQRRAMREIAKDLGKRAPMSRLLEGDVGSGKTLVAAATTYGVVNTRPPGRSAGTLQAAYMAPTEILAAQHFRSFMEYFRHLPIAIGLLTGSGCKKFPSKLSPDEATDISRAQLLKWVKNGEIALVVGTHALIQKSVQFQNLAYAIVDEQHRFGVRQRRELARKSGAAAAMPHFLSMTATPIPRTLALTMYGDLDLSVLDELPPGRAAVTTTLVKKGERAKVYEKVREELRAGRQAYVICPRIEEPDPKKENALQGKAVKAEAARLKKEVFPEYRIGMLHGAMSPKEKDAVMGRFSAHELDILVATSVVEVGVNVPNATVILIEGAERFGLSQLHQLRGRVMRSSHPPHCYLLPETTSDISLRRLRALEKSADGFALAESDLQLRGAGDLYGRQQWGISDLGMEALRNPRLISAARSEAIQLVAADATLRAHAALARRVHEASQGLHGE